MFIYFYVKIATPSLNKVNPFFPANNPLFPSKPLLKADVLSSLPPPFEKLVGGSTPPAERGGCTL